VFATSDTIVAIATPPGPGGIGIVRLSGPDAQLVTRRLITHRGSLEPRHATLTRVVQAAPRVSGSRDGCNDDGRNDSGRDVEVARPIDQVVVTYFPAPGSYTGEDVVEVSAHGSPVVLTEIVKTAVGCGARLAERGEFTLRAFLNGRIDLPQAEAVVDLIEASTPLQARAAFDQLNGTITQAIGEIEAVLFDLIAHLEASVDFPEEGYHFVTPAALGEALDDLITRTSTLVSGARRGRLLREGVQIAIVGRPNVGKSSLFNALVGASRAIVADQPGTTRDLVTETVDLDGLRATIVDTAGLRPSDDIVESEGVRRAEQAARAGDVVLLVADRSESWRGVDEWVRALGGLDGRRGGASQHARGDRRVLAVANKSDLPSAWSSADLASVRELLGDTVEIIEVSAATGAGIGALRGRIAAALDFEMRERPVLTNVRHLELVERAACAFRRARAAVGTSGAAISEEFVLADLQEARNAFGEVVGRRTPEDVLERIFSTFCIGK